MAHWRLWAALAFVAILLAVAHASGLRDNLSLAYIQQTFLANKLAGVAVFVALFTLGNLLQLPGLLFLAAAVLALGKVWGGVVTYLAACVSCTVTFLVFRWVGGDALLRLKSPMARRILKNIHARPVRSVVLLRTFMQTLPALNMSLAMSGIPLRHYLLGTLLGLPLPIALYCVFFDLLAKGVKSL
jgi:uncharacterized membrane protein YdjX (TVP38/TMEM64 family)